MKTAKRNGFTVVESLMAVLIFSLSGLAFSSFVTISASSQSKNKAKMSVAQSKGQVLAMIANRSVWFRNLKDAGLINHPSEIYGVKKLNPELACLRDGTPCAETATGYNLTLTDQNGSIVVDGIDSSKGFTKEGAVCTGFSEANPSSACPWRMTLKWSPICPTAAACTHPQVNIKVAISASEAFLQANNLTVTQTSVMVEQPKTQPAFARKILLLTNSVHYGYPSSLTIDPMPYVITDSPGTISFSLPKTVSVRGGTVAMRGQSIVYSPEYDASVVPVPTEKIFGTDWFNYKIKDSYTGIETMATVYVQVMTPYTWTGLAGGGDTSITNKRNFCGLVVDNKCDGTTFPAAFLSATAAADTNLVFNENCTNCNAEIGTRVLTASVETSPYYSGTITQRADLVAGAYTNAYGASVWRREATFRFTSGLWEGQAGALVVNRQGEKWICWTCLTPENSFFRIEGGTFKAPPNIHVVGSLYMPSPTAFQHNGGTFFWTGAVQWGSVQCAGDCYIGSEDVQFADMIIGFPIANPSDNTASAHGFTYSLGWPRRTYLRNGFKVAGNLTVANVAGEAQLATYNPTDIPNVQLSGNLILPTANHGGDYSYGLPSMITLVGSGDQKIIGQALTEAERRDPDRPNCGPGITVNKPSGKITVKDTVCFAADFILQNAGSYAMEDVNITNRGHKWNVPVHVDLNGQEIDGLYYTSGIRLVLKSDVVVNKMFHFGTPLSSIGAIRNDTTTTPRYVKVRGDADFGPMADSQHDGPEYAATIRFDGAGDQTVTGAMATKGGAISNHIHVEKTSGTITFDGSYGVQQDFFVNNGTTVFGPTFSIHNKNSGANYIRTRIRLNDPVNQVFSKMTSNRTIQAMTPIYVKDLELNSVGGWIGGFYTHLYGGGASPIYVSNNLTFGLSPTYYTRTLMSARSGLQQVILNGTGAQTISIQGENMTGSWTSLELKISNTSASPVKITGNGEIGKLTVDTGATVELDPSSILALNAVVSGTLNKSGTTPTGSQTVFGAGVINN